MNFTLGSVLLMMEVARISYAFSLRVSDRMRASNWAFLSSLALSWSRRFSTAVLSWQSLSVWGWIRLPLPLLLVCGSTFSIITGHKEAAAAVFVEDELTASFILPDAVLIETVEQPRRRTDEQLMLSETNLAKKMKALQCFDWMLAQVIYIM